MPKIKNTKPSTFNTENSKRNYSEIKTAESVMIPQFLFYSKRELFVEVEDKIDIESVVTWLDAIYIGL